MIEHRRVKMKREWSTKEQKNSVEVENNFNNLLSTFISNNFSFPFMTMYPKQNQQPQTLNSTSISSKQSFTFKNVYLIKSPILTYITRSITS